jgi:hypothetical protein
VPERRLAFEVAGERLWPESWWGVEQTGVGPEVSPREESIMGTTSSTPDVPGAAGTGREEGGSSLATPNEGAVANGLPRAGAVSGAGIEEDWAPMAIGDSAFWLKD